MSKKKVVLSDFMTAEEASQFLTEKLGRDIPNTYMYKLAHRKKHPVRTQQMGNRLLYHRGDVEATTIKKKNQ